MKVIQKNISILIWCCSIVIILYSALVGMDQTSVATITKVVLGASILATVLYFAPISERVKAVMVLVLTAVSTTLCSIILGGNSATFIVSFIVLAMAVLYFDPIILVGYSSIYLAISIGVITVNREYIIGYGMKPVMGVVMIFTYIVMTACLFMATKYGKNYLQKAKEDEQEAQEKASVIEQQTKAAHLNCETLYAKVEVSDNTVKELTVQANDANDNVKKLNTAEQETMRTFNDLTSKINHSTEWIEENYKLIDKLTENFSVALNKVSESKEFSDQAENSMNEILMTIRHAYESIVKSSQETEKIETIIKDINEIASQTNLLAINASIEAARVGEKGAGFDIVADEIRTLSVQSKQASENINMILGSLSDSLQATNDKIKKGMDAIEYGISNLNQMIQCIQTIDLYSNQSQITLNQEVSVFEQIKKDFSGMVMEVEKAMKSAESNLASLETVAESIGTQTQRTEQVSDHLTEMEEIANQLKNQF